MKRDDAQMPRSGHDLALVLSGGGTRGVAHAGALAALLDRGFAPALIAGSSAGAIVGALYGAGLDPEAIARFFHEEYPFRFGYFSPRKAGLFDSESVLQRLPRWIPADSFEDLRCELRVVTTNLITAERRVFSRGPLHRAIAASAAFPGFLTPVEIDGEPHGDGGIVDNFPVETAREEARVLVGVYVSPLRRATANELDNPLRVLQRAFDIGMHATARQSFHACDILVMPDGLAERSSFQTADLDTVFEAGRRAIESQLDRLATLLEQQPAG